MTAQTSTSASPATSRIVVTHALIAPLMLGGILWMAFYGVYSDKPLAGPKAAAALGLLGSASGWLVATLLAAMILIPLGLATGLWAAARTRATGAYPMASTIAVSVALGVLAPVAYYWINRASFDLAATDVALRVAKMAMMGAIVSGVSGFLLTFRGTTAGTSS